MVKDDLNKQKNRRRERFTRSRVASCLTQRTYATGGSQCHGSFPPRNEGGDKRRTQKKKVPLSQVTRYLVLFIPHFCFKNFAKRNQYIYIYNIYKHNKAKMF
uniref:Uncharacterized protein n=1 Tax=Trypanosoma congolense (strain IL3000) TaxID=1068625 RepID=G0UUJ6_TRYCI|nr:hypothetical protein, unlikely [Trypanosoma congolense IL3000]